MTSWLIRRIREARNDDSGLGLVVVVLFLAVVSTLTVSVSAIVINSLNSTNHDRQSLSALSTAEGGVAQAVQVVRANPPGYFTCQEPAAGSAPSGKCTTNPAGWTSATNPEKVSDDGTIGSCVANKACYQVWISTLVPYNPLPVSSTNPNGHTVQYRIHSTGVSGGGPAARSLMVDLKATLDQFPMGIYSNSMQTSGSPGIHHESVFTAGCLEGRGKDGANGGGLSFDAYDPTNLYADYDWAYDLPEAAHATQTVVRGNACNDRPIHSSGVCAWSTGGGSNYDHFPFDQDSMGGDLTGTSCYKLWTSPVTGKTYPTTSKFTSADLYAVGYRPSGLTPGEYDMLQQQAQATGTYLSGTNATRANVQTALNNLVTTAATTTAVLYIDASTVGTLTLGPGDIPSQFFRSPISGITSCPLSSLIIVVRHGSLTYNSTGNGNNSSSYLTASIFVPEATYTGNGSAKILGTLFANNASMGGTQDFYMDQCFVNNPPSMLLGLDQVRYHQVDTQNIQ